MKFLPACRVAIFACLLASTAGAATPVITDGPSIQKAIDARPGEVVYIPPGTYQVNAAIRIAKDNAGLVGPGRIVQTNPDEPVVVVTKASGVVLREVTLTRTADRPANRPAVSAEDCADLTLDDLRVLDNRAPAGAINLFRCDGVRVANCAITNYSRIATDDRTASADWGYAFACIDGTGIQAKDVKGLIIQGNRVIEREMIPTPELKEKHGLGKFTKRAAARGQLTDPQTWERGYVENWHQGSAIAVTGPTRSDALLISGNYIQNAAQGIDIHADHVTISGNVIDNALIGMKAMHGSRNTLIVGNQFIRNDLWAIGLMPGAGSHAAAKAGDAKGDAGPNVDGGSVIANNVISDFGYGHAHWIWGSERSPILLDRGQKPENPRLRDVVLTGNVVYDAGRDEAAPAPPRYRWAVMIESGSAKLPGPIGIRFGANVFHPGTAGECNIPLPKTPSLPDEPSRSSP